MKKLTRIQPKLRNVRQQETSPPHNLITQYISEAISKGELKPGDQLLSERKMAVTIGTSRTAVREAFARLASLGLIEVKAKRGAYVRQINLGILAQPLAAILLKEEESLTNLMEVRSILETKAVLLASERATPADIARIRFEAQRAIEDMDSGVDSGESDMRFHLSLTIATHNELLCNFMSMMSSLMKETYGPARKYMLQGPNASVYIKHHLGIAEAIAHKRGKQAERLILEHLKMASQEMVDFFKQRELQLVKTA